MKIIDVHNHVYPDAIAERALSGTLESLEVMGDGKEAGLARAMDEAGISRSVCLAVANTPAQVESANDFVGSLDRSRFIGFGSVHADNDPQANLASLEKNRLCGVKVHPLFQRYGLDDPGLHRTLELLEGKYIVLVHVGDTDDPEMTRGCTPERLAEVVERFPGIDFIACHLGGYRMLDESESTVIGLPVYLDTSWPPSLGNLDGERVKAVIERHGSDRVLFGSDWPMASPRGEIEVVKGLGLSDDDTAAVLGGNMSRLLERYERSA